jgi:hypothetical protein
VNAHTFTVDMTDEESDLFMRAFPDDDGFADMLRNLLLARARNELRRLDQRAIASRANVKPKPRAKFKPTRLKDFEF